MTETMDPQVLDKLFRLSQEIGLDVKGGTIRRTSSRFCLGVEHGDYNGTELFGVGTDRYIFLAYKPNDSGRTRLYSGNFPGDGIIDFKPGEVPEPRSQQIADTWARFPFGVDFILRREGIVLKRGVDVILFGNIPGGGMSRSASLTLNLILSLCEANQIEIKDPFQIVDMAQAVENEYIGSPCGQLDQIMILFAKKGMGTHYQPGNRTVRYVTLGEGALDFRLVSLDTGTVRPGLEKSTYKIRRTECDELVSLCRDEFGITCLADVADENLYHRIEARFGKSHPDLMARLNYIYHGQKRFFMMLAAWESGDVETVGKIFREDGLGLRDDYKISGPELECMCDIARTVPGVLGERMLGGGDKGAAGALVKAENVASLKEAVDSGFPRAYPSLEERYAVHVCRMVKGVEVFEGLLS